MTYGLTVSPLFQRRAALLVRDDPQGMADLYGALLALAEEPRPKASAYWAQEQDCELRRLRHGAYRVLYEIREEQLTVLAVHVGRIDAPSS